MALFRIVQCCNFTYKIVLLISLQHKLEFLRIVQCGSFTCNIGWHFNIYTEWQFLLVTQGGIFSLQYRVEVLCIRHVGTCKYNTLWQFYV